MLREKFVDKLVKVADEPRSLGYKILAALLGAVLFLAVLPILLFFVGFLVDKYLIADRWRWLEIAFSLLCVLAGLLLLAWSGLAQTRIGRGTPVPMAPTRKLVVSGPYRLCRNPIQLGAVLYYLGLGTYFGSIGIGVVMSLIALVLGGFYHKFVEEKELERRFGQEYQDYRKNTPFIIPKW